MLIACPTCGRLQFDMDTVVADIERRLEAYEDPIEVAVLGCAVNGIGEASHADFGITGAKNEGLIFSRGKPLKKVPQEQLVDELFKEIDKYATTKRIDVDAAEQAAGAEWLQRIEEENAGELTPERLAKLEAERRAPTPTRWTRPCCASTSRRRRPRAAASPAPEPPPGGESPTNVTSTTTWGGRDDTRAPGGARGTAERQRHAPTAVDAGLSRRQIERRIEAGWLVSRHTGVYAVGYVPTRGSPPGTRPCSHSARAPS